MFDRAFVINLDRRPDRLEQFHVPDNWPFVNVERWPAVDGMECDVPKWFHAPVGAWGCMQTHIAIWWAQIDNGWDSVLVFEDDAVFCRDAVAIMQETMNVVPDNWDQIYFGGQHLDTNERPPEVAIQDKLTRGRYVNRTHAYAMRSSFACDALDYIECPNDRNARIQHVDYMLGDLHDSHNVYTPWRFCIGQARGSSDVSNGKRGPRRNVEHWWNQYPIVDPVGVS